MIQTYSPQKGFTIVELLIVIVVIGILAAITIVAFNGVQNRANDSVVRQDLASISKSLAMSHTLQGTYPVSAAELADPDRELVIKPSRSAYLLTSNNFIYCYGSGTNYALIGKSKSGTTYYVNNTNTTTPTEFTYPFPASQVDVCPQAGAGGAGAWGFAGPGWSSWVQ